jgi:hypothetical protein
MMLNPHSLDDDAFRYALDKAARQRRIDVNTNQLVTSLRRDSTVAVAPLRAFDVTPATALTAGADAVLAYIDLPHPNLPPDFYTIHVRANVTDVGELDGTAEFVDRRGHVPHRVKARVNVHHLSVPDPLPFPHTLINLESRIADPDEFRPEPQHSVIVLIRCPNGLTIVLIWP